MADTVSTNTDADGSRRKIIQLLNFSDGTGESAVVKVDASADADADYYSIQEIKYDIGGFTSVDLEFDATTNTKIVEMPTGTGYYNLSINGGRVDPLATVYTGDIVLTTLGAAADATYDITISLIKKKL